ncbi:MAG: sigma-70 family RNA polymerase sigma factor [Armatimonadetes bacterium]|nr:sigma-70 family RNA polymerase sigma factor [Armatimonadota bacterium]MDW8121897.1 sigma-70 family RNA polymerase sigma factor [Armatimonadota bacterium]
MKESLATVEEARPRLYDIAARLTKDKELREDLVSEMTLFLLQKWDLFAQKGEGYLFRACYRHAIDVLRRGRSIDSKFRSGVLVESLCELCEKLGVQECTLASVLRGEDDPESVLRARCLMQELLDCLTPLQKEILFLLMEGYRPSEIAEARGVSRPTITKLIRSIQKKLSRLRTP